MWRSPLQPTVACSTAPRKPQLSNRSSDGTDRSTARPWIPRILDLLKDAEGSEKESGRYKSKVRFATIGDLIFAHTASPPPNRMRFFSVLIPIDLSAYCVRCLADVAPSGSIRLIDIGSGSGAGGIVAARWLCAQGNETELVLGDINRKALAFSAINAVINDVPAAKVVFSDVLGGN